MQASTVAHKATQQAAQHAPTLWQRAVAFIRRFGWDNLQENVGGAAGFLRIGMWFGAGFACGYLFKKYFKTVLTTLVLVVVAIKGLEYQQVLIINWPAFKTMVGIESQATLASGARSIVALVKHNAGIFIAGLGGLVVGNQLA